jgi:hypothetical protein
MKKILKFISVILILVLCVILSLDLVILNIRNISKEYISEEKIKEQISNINLTDLLVDENNNELKEVTELKNELVNAGFPIETVDSIIDSEAVKDATSKVISESIEYVIYDKSTSLDDLISSEDILEFSKENIDNVSEELQSRNVPKSELLTEEKRQEIITKMEEVAPKVEESARTLVNTIKEKIMDTEQYQNLKKLQNIMDKVLKYLRFIYSDTFNIILISVCAVCIVLILILCHSKYKYFKYFGITSLICSIIYFGLSFAISKLETYTTNIPNILEKFVSNLLNNLKSSFMSLFIIYLIVAILLIVLNIIIYRIKEHKENKKIEEI